METQHLSAHFIFFLHTTSSHCLLTLWTHGAHPPVSSRDNCLSAVHWWWWSGPGTARGRELVLYLPDTSLAWNLQRRKVGGMKCAGDLAVDFNCAFYDFLISYVRKMLRFPSKNREC